MQKHSTRVYAVSVLAFIIGLAAVMLNAPSVMAQDDPEAVVVESLVPFGSVWSYLDTGVDPGAGWEQPGFDDSAWLSGPAQLGYGDGDESTVVGFGPDPVNRYPVTLFRGTFDVTEVFQLLNIAMQVERDDAAIVFVNGTEVWRSTNLPANPTFTSFATGNAIEGALDDVVVPLDLLVEGTNTVAVQLHNRGAANSDISFDLAIEADRDPNIPPGPRMARDEFVGPASEPITGTVATNDLAGLTYSVDPADSPNPAEGVLTVGADGAFTFTPVAGFVGTVVVPVIGCDPADPEFCGARDLSFRIEGVVALDDETDTDFETLVSGNVAGNDSANGNGELTWSLLTTPGDNEGELDFGADGAWSFTPAAGFDGTVAVEYQACDAQGDCGQALLTIRVATDELVLEFSRERGYFNQPFALTITASDPQAEIRVSTDWGTEWFVDDFLARSEAYTGPLQVSDSMQVRAVAIDADGQRTELQSHSFIDISSYSAQEQAVIESYPTFVSTGSSAGSRSADARTISEFWHPDGSSTAAPAGIRNRQGGTGQAGDFRLYYRSEYGDGRLDYELFPNEPAGGQTAGAHDKVNFHGGSQDQFGFSWSYNGCPVGAGTLMRDRFYQRLQRDVNGDGVPGEYYMVWLQGRLSGIKNAEDVPQQGFMEEYFGGNKDAYSLWTWYSKELAPGNAYSAARNKNSFYAALDVTNHIDYLLVGWFSGNTDWASSNRNNNVVVGGLLNGPYYHWTWDSHATSPGCSRSWGATPTGMTTPLSDADFQMDFADRALLHFGPGGAMTEAALLSRWDELAAELRPAVPLAANQNSWESAQQNVRRQISGSSAALLSWLEGRGYASTVSPVSYSVPAGAAASGTEVTLSGGGEIWFTTDGTDPRASGGAVSGSAHRYQAPVLLPDGTVQMLARVKQGNDWSAARPMIFRVGDGPGLVINEINFHPSDGQAGGVEVDGDEYEFIELANLGSTAVDLEYFRLQGGVRFKFDYGRSPVLQPGEFAVLAENAERFTERYGFAPDGEFLDKLSNSSDEIRLVDTELNTIDTVVYEDAWDPRTDGNGTSLSFIGAGNNNIAEAWGRSATSGGSPGAANVVAYPQAAEVPGIIVNEWNSVSPTRALSGADERLGQVQGNGGDWFELVVVDDEVDARGWTIEVGDIDDVTTLTLSQDPVWSNLRSGTIITIAEDATITGADGTTYTEDESYDPVGGDWWIHAVAGEEGGGALVTAANFAVTANDWQAIVRDAGGAVQWGPVGEGIGALASGVGNTEVGELEADPSVDLDPIVAPYDDGDDSTFGLANVFDGNPQNLSVLRAVVNAPPAIDALPDRTDTQGDTIAPITNGASDLEGDPFTWAAENLPPGLTIDPATGTISGQVTEAGTYDVVVQAVADLNVGVAPFTWTVAANQAPAIDPIADPDSITNEPATIDPTATDAEGDPFTWSADGLPPGVVIDESTGQITGAPTTAGSYPVTVTATDQWGSASEEFTWTVTDPEAIATVSCADDDTGTIDVAIFNSSGGFATYRVSIGVQAQQRSISPGLSTMISRTGVADGPVDVTVDRNGASIYAETITVACAGPAPTPTPVPAPTPTPVSTPGPVPTPTPQPGGGGPVVDPVEVNHTVTCLAGNGRIDTNIVNTGDASAIFRIELEGLSPRQFTVAAGDWWRMPITGRPDKDYSMTITRDGSVVSQQTLTVSCDTDPSQVSAPEVHVVNACRGGNGYLLFQFANPTDAARGYVIEFEGVPNRSTGAQAYGAAVRAVTGRQDGDHNYAIRVGSTYVASGTITVAC